MHISIDMDSTVMVKCECGMEGRVADICAALHWAFMETIRHGKGCHIDIAVDMTLHAKYEERALGIP